MNFPFALLALAIGAFGIGVTEFGPMGMLSAMAADLGVSIPKAGLLVSVYAVGVMLGAPLMTLGTRALPRHAVLVGMMAVYAVGNLMSALATDYATLLVARVVTSLSHGAFFGVGAVVAASVVPPARQASAVALMFMGLTLANVGGVPLASWVGEQVGWRTAFGGMVGVGLLAMVALWWALPRHQQAAPGSLRNELAVLRRGPVLSALAVTVLASGAMFAVFTYISPILREQTHTSAPFVTAMLVLYGVGLTLGNGLGGRLADRSVDGTLLTVMAVLTAVLLAFAVAMRWPWPAAACILAWGVATFAIVPALQMRVMQAAADAPNLASSLNIGAFNLGNALGAALGGGVLSLGWGYPMVAVAGAALAAAGWAVVWLSRQPGVGAFASEAA